MPGKNGQSGFPGERGKQVCTAYVHCGLSSRVAGWVAWLVGWLVGFMIGWFVILFSLGDILSFHFRWPSHSQIIYINHATCDDMIYRGYKLRRSLVITNHQQMCILIHVV